jgi:phosphohistidine swiveling domain-containing protein
VWDAPGPGMWFMAREHVPVPVSRIYAELLSHAATGWATSAERYGLAEGPPQWGNVNGWMYYGPGTSDAEALARREVAAAETLATRRWEADIDDWYGEIRPRMEATNRALQAEDVTTMDDAALADHVGRAFDHARDSFPVHFALHAAFATGGGAAFEALQARGMSRTEIAAQLAGGSPGSGRARALVDAIVAEVGDREIATIDDLRGPALDAYLDEFGLRGLGRDEVRGANLVERPDLVVASVRARRDGAGGTAQPPSTGDAELDALRALYSLNDDNGGITGTWPQGIVRRAGLEIARRIGAHDPNDVFEATGAELRALAAGGGPSVDELRARAAHRAAAEAVDPPGMLTGPDVPAPPAVEIPPSVARLEALRAVLWAPDARSEEPLSGIGIGTETYRGRACVIDGDGVLDVEPGDVLVAFVTHSAHNTVFPIAGAVATQEGGLLSHPAVLSRELGIPAVVGVRNLLERVKTGDIVEVDPVAGMVRLVDPT